jgi:hypothetical protein
VRSPERRKGKHLIHERKMIQITILKGECGRKRNRKYKEKNYLPTIYLEFLPKGRCP